MAGAFRESPSYKHMLESRGEAKREVLLASLFEKNLALQKDACWCSRRPEDGSLQCAFLLTPSDAPPATTQPPSFLQYCLLAGVRYQPLNYFPPNAIN